MTNESGVEIGVSTVIRVQGQAYIVMKVEAAEDYQMKRITLTALDPYSAQQEMGRVQAQREARERSERLLPKLEKMVDEASQ